MVNYCDNYLRVEGNKKELKDFTEKFTKNGIEAFVPTPKELIGMNGELRIGGGLNGM